MLRVMSSIRISAGTGASSDPSATDFAEPVGGLLALEHTDELALGGAEDYGLDDVLALGGAEGEDGPVFGMVFGEAREPTGSWDLADIQDLVVNETRGHFESDGGARDDVMVMEEEFDDDDDVVVAVWEPDSPGGELQFAAVIRKKVMVPKQYLPYGFIAAGLGVLLLVAGAGIVLVGLVALLASPKVEVRPLDRAKIPKIEIERKPIEHQTADEILEEVLGDEGAQE